jgi:hypothetical protein
MSKGERNMRRETSGGALEVGMRWSMSVSINAKGGYCWTVGCH